MKENSYQRTNDSPLSIRLDNRFFKKKATFKISRYKKNPEKLVLSLSFAESSSSLFKKDIKVICIRVTLVFIRVTQAHYEL